LVVSCGRRHSWNVEAGTVMFLNLKKILLNESNYMVMFFNKPHYTFSIYMYVILDIGVRYASNVHLLVDTVYNAHCWSCFVPLCHCRSCFIHIKFP
jgi:hypothetical protein